MRIGIDASRAFGAQRTGTEEYSYQLTKHMLALPEAKNDAWILYTRDGGRPDFDLGSNVVIAPIGFKYLWTQVGLSYRTWVDKLDLLWVPAHTLPVLRKPGLKTVVTVHGIEYEWLPAYENALQRWYLPLSTEYAVAAANKIIAVSEFTKKQLVERLGVDEKKINVIHEGVENKTLSTKPEILNKLKIQKQKYVLFVGTVQPRKNLLRLIQAMDGLEIKLVIAGKLGWNYEEVVEMAKKHNVFITGYINEAERDALLQNALVYVQPSITEGFGLPIIEAMQAGVPVASSNGGALSEVVGEAGLLFDPLNIDEMREKLEQIISSKKLRDELVSRGKKRIEEFSWEKAARETYKYLASSYSK